MSNGEFAQLVNQRKQQQPLSPVEAIQTVNKGPGEFSSLVKARRQELSPQAEPAQPITEKKGILAGIKEAFTGEQRTTPEVEAAPSIYSLTDSLTTGSLKDDIKLSARLLLTTDPEEQANIIQTAIPEAKIRKDEKGNIFVKTPQDDKERVVNKPGFSVTDLFNIAGTAAAFTPSTKVASMAPRLGAKLLAGGAGAAATQAGIEKLQESGGGEFDKGDIALAGGLGVAAEAVAPIIKSMAKGSQASKIAVDKADLESALKEIAPAQESVKALEKATGSKVGLFRAQQTLDPTQLLKQRLLPQLDAGSRKAAQALEKQNKEVFDATAELLNTIAPADVVSTGAKRFQNAAKTAVEAAKERRSMAVKPLFDSALDAGADVDLTPVKSIIKENLVDSPAGGEISRVMGKINSMIGGEQPSLRKLQKVKFELDNMLEKFGDNALGNTTKRQVVELKKMLVEQMEKASPLYKEANAEFAALSPSVKKLEDSIIGSVSKVDDVNLKKISAKIFDATETNPEVLRRAKKVIDQVDPGAWNDLLRVEFQRRFAGIQSLAEDLPGEVVGNVPAQLRKAIFGNPERRRTLLSAMTEDQRKNFVYLDDVLRRASAGRAAGSPTAPFGEQLSKLKGVSSVLRDLIFSPIISISKTGERGIFNRNVRKMTEIMFDPNFQPKLKELRQLNPTSKKAEQMLREMFDQAKGASQALKPTSED